MRAWLMTAALLTSSSVLAQEPVIAESPSPAFQAMLKDYESRVLQAAADSDANPVAFLVGEAPGIARSAFGANWPVVREESRRLLSQLPVYDTAMLEKQKWVSEYGDELFPGSPDAAQLATGLDWDPKFALLVVATVVLQKDLTKEELFRNSMIGGGFGVHPYRAMWHERPALVGEYGFWLVAMEYELTTEGMYVPLRVAIAPRFESKEAAAESKRAAGARD
jgi:hypothetical protein